MARLIRSNNTIIAGLAENFHIDVKLMRLIFVILLFVTFSAMGVAYIILWVLMPVDARSRNYKERMQDRLGR